MCDVDGPVALDSKITVLMSYIPLRLANRISVSSQHRAMSMSASPFSAAHRRYVKSLYKRMLENERNWVVRYDLWRARACAVRAEFERNR
jgi:hypothetical protein